MSRKLHAIRGNNSFCGPAAIASVLGLTTDHAARVLRSISGDRRVTGVYPVHFVQALRNLGCEVEHLTVPAVHRMPVRQWLEVHASLFAEKHIVIDFEAPLTPGTPTEMTQAAADSLAARIRQHPGQYYWLHRRFKTRPEGQPSLY